MNGRQACVFVCVLLVGLGYASAAPQGEFKRARDITDCTTCIEHGYGWCPRRRRCGYFRNKQCSGMSTDYANEVLTQELTYENYEKALYDPRRTSFVFFHSELDKGAELFTMAEAVKLFAKADGWMRERALFFSVNHDVYPDIAKVHGLRFSLSSLPALIAIDAAHKPSPEWRELPEFIVEKKIPFIPRLYYRRQHQPTNLVDFMLDTLRKATARIDELDALVPAFMQAALGGEGNATEVYMGARQVVADYVGNLVAEAEEAAAEYERQRLEFEEQEKAKAEGREEPAHTEVSVDSQASVVDEDVEAKDGAVLGADALAKLRTVQTGAPEYYLAVMEMVLYDGTVAIVRKANELRQSDTPRPLPDRLRLEILEVFLKEMF